MLKVGVYFLLSVATCGLFQLGWATAQAERRDLREPALVLETGARTAACDVLTFTPDGRFLLAAGDDKVVRIWQVTDAGLEQKTVQTLRWSIWREQRGAIYALALSPDKQNQYVAIGGYGMRSSAVAVLERTSGKIERSTCAEPKPGENYYTVRSLAFSPQTGKRLAYGTADGSVWLWDWNNDKASTRLGKHESTEPFNSVRFLAFLDEERLISVAEDGQVLQWNVAKPNGKPVVVARFTVTPVMQVVLSADRSHLAAAGKKSGTIERRTLAGKELSDIVLPAGDYPDSLAFDPKGQRLAIGVRTIDPQAAFLKETADRVDIYDLSKQPPQPTPAAKPTFHAEALAFHPDGDRLAVAGGNNHEVTLWDVNQTRKVSEISGSGNCLWAVAFSAKNGKHLGFRDQRANNPNSPNERGQGPWKVFDLDKRVFVRAKDFQPLEARNDAGGWSVKFSDQGRKSAYTWYVVSPAGTSYPLPLDTRRDDMPNCYTFLKPVAGQPVRLIVGHYWGLSLFELSELGPQRTRLFTGHEGEVMAVAVSPDQQWLVSAGRDQTLAAWSLQDWASHPELGAKFALQGGKLLATAVDIGSPAWEAGLVKGDDVVLLAANARKIYHRDATKPYGRPEDCIKPLLRAVPGQELYFGVRRAGQADMVEMLTTVRQRPLWRFFPTRNRDWILWMWRNNYYDTFVHGDFAVGWQVNNRDNLDREPTFYRLEQFRDYFHKPAVIDKLVGSRDVNAALRVAAELRGEKGNPVPIHFDAIEPPPVSITVSDEIVRDRNLTVTLNAVPRDSNPDHAPHRWHLWVNDHLFLAEDAKGKPLAKREVVIPRSVLRAGRNDLMLQVYNRLGGRTEAPAPPVTYDHQIAASKLYLFLVGIDDYRDAAKVNGQPLFKDLTSAKNDVAAMRVGWLAQRKTVLYRSVEEPIVLMDKQATREAILQKLDEVAAKVQADDRVILFFAGHGYKPPGVKGSDHFVFCCPNFDPARPAETGVTSKDLYEKLAAIRGRKTMLLDACHAGDTIHNPIRSLTPGGKGPVILAACDPSQQSWEDPKLQNGLFTYAIHEAMINDQRFTQADSKPQDGKLNAEEIFVYVQLRLPELLKNIDREDLQHPVSFPLDLDPHPLCAKDKPNPK